MRVLRHKGKPAGWPFILLVAAWICANSPQSLATNVIEWAKGARHFSHQQQLRTEVAYLLAGPHMRTVLTASKEPSKSPLGIPIPDEAVMKKIDLSEPRLFERLTWPSEACNFARWVDRTPGSFRAEPAFLPPRSRDEA
jgi:hypothetical protein